MVTGVLPERKPAGPKKENEMPDPKDLTPEQALEVYSEMHENFKAAEEAATRLEEYNLRLTIELEREKRSSEHWCKQYTGERNAYERFRNGVAKHLSKYAEISNEEAMDKSP